MSHKRVAIAVHDRLVRRKRDASRGYEQVQQKPLVADRRADAIYSVSVTQVSAFKSYSKKKVNLDVGCPLRPSSHLGQQHAPFCAHTLPRVAAAPAAAAATSRPATAPRQRRPVPCFSAERARRGPNPGVYSYSHGNTPRFSHGSRQAQKPARNTPSFFRQKCAK